MSLRESLLQEKGPSFSLLYSIHMLHSSLLRSFLLVEFEQLRQQVSLHRAGLLLRLSVNRALVPVPHGGAPPLQALEWYTEGRVLKLQQLQVSCCPCFSFRCRQQQQQISKKKEFAFFF